MKIALNQQLALDEEQAQQEKIKLERQHAVGMPVVATALAQDKTEY